jgi:hypothetical protein
MTSEINRCYRALELEPGALITLKGLPKNKTPVFWRFMRSYHTR